MIIFIVLFIVSAIVVKSILKQINLEDYTDGKFIENTENLNNNSEKTIIVSIPCEVDELDCKNFANQRTAQDLYEACGGIDFDIHKLDEDKDGIACEEYEYDK